MLNISTDSKVIVKAKVNNRQDKNNMTPIMLGCKMWLKLQKFTM